MMFAVSLLVAFEMNKAPILLVILWVIVSSIYTDKIDLLCDNMSKFGKGYTLRKLTEENIEE